MRHTFDGVDKLVIGLGGALVLVGIVVLGIVEVLDGPPYGAAPLTNDAGDVVATTLVDPNVRTALVVLGIVVLLLWGVYRMAQPTVEPGETREEAWA